MKVLYLLPNLLDPEGDCREHIPSVVKEIIPSLDGLFAESEKAARKYLLRFISREKMQEVSIRLLNEHTSLESLHEYINLIEKDQKWGVVSDAGLPVLADPGSQLVFLAHQKKIRVKTFSGPSSIMMALVLSGLSGQAFTFHGYLPRKEEDLVKQLKQMEEGSQIKTQIWIEAPYRTDKMIQVCTRSLHPKTIFCVANALCTKEEKVLTAPIQIWKSFSHSFGKSPAVFLLSKNKK